MQCHSQLAGFFLCDLAIVLRICVSHVGEASAQPLIIRTNQRILSLQVDVIANQYQRALRGVEIDSAGGVGENHGTDSHTPEDANRKRYFLCGVALVKMHAPLHGGDRNASRPAENHASRVPDGCGLGESWDLCVGDVGRVGEGIGEGAQP